MRIFFLRACVCIQFICMCFSRLCVTIYLLGLGSVRLAFYMFVDVVVVGTHEYLFLLPFYYYCYSSCPSFQTNL